MLEKPDLPDEKLIACLNEHYALTLTHLDFLPLGADHGTAVYRAEDAAQTYFVKLRRGDFDDIILLVPKLLHDAGVDPVIVPLVNRHGRLSAPLGEYHVMVYPFVEGSSGFERPLTAEQWIALGRALKAIHSAALPRPVLERIPAETYSAVWRAEVRAFQSQAASQTFADPVAAALAGLLNAQRVTIDLLVGHAERLARVLQKRRLPFILCHADLHIGNVLIAPEGRLYVVDWDTMILAPKERDLMFMGMGMGSTAVCSTEAQAAYFYQGYGPTEVDAAALAYYRCERIVQDIQAYCREILLTEGDSADRQNGLAQLSGQFEPGEVVEVALRTVADMPPMLW